ncbi:MAG: PH domain-containing protein [Candidatus Heimdallarchaeota archaeon]
MSDEKIGYEGGLSRNFIKKEVLKNNLLLITGAVILLIAFYLLYTFDPEVNFEFFIILTILCIVIPYIAIVLITWIYSAAYVRSFSYKVQESNIIINHGVFTKARVTIPYRRIQNINITNGVFDRMFKIFTIKIETAGHSAVSKGTKTRGIGPEGYIPGLEDPYIIENKIKEMISKFTTTSNMFEEKLFKPEALAFDNFISYILSKMREGEKLKTSIKELRENLSMSAAHLAEKVGVPIQTITYLEEGRYSPSLVLAYKIAEVLNCKIEDLFKLA